MFQEKQVEEKSKYKIDQGNKDIQIRKFVILYGKLKYSINE